MIFYIHTERDNLGRYFPDLPTDAAELLGCTTNTIGPMGAGIAKRFAQYFNKIGPEEIGLEAWYKLCIQQGKITKGGDCRLFPIGNGQQVLTMCTKEHYNNPSQLEWIEIICKRIAEVATARKIGSIALPPLGCGHGGLKWIDQVGPIMAEHLHPILTNVRIYIPYGSEKYYAPNRPEVRAKNRYNLYTIGYRLEGAYDAIRNLFSQYRQENKRIILVDIREHTDTGNPKWRKDTLRNELLFKDGGYCWVQAAGNTRHRIKGAPHVLNNEVVAMRQLERLLKDYDAIVLMCACEHDHCHRVTVTNKLINYLVNKQDKTPVMVKHLLVD